MNLAIDIFIIYAVWRWADWKNWRKYHASMIFAGAMNLLYHVLSLTHYYFLWKMVPSFFTFTTEEIIHTFILLPGTTLIFLSRWPKNISKQLKYFIKWILIFVLGEYALNNFGGIEYYNGWNIGLSFLFCCVMFPGILIHFKKPGLAYPLFIIITFLGIWIFRIPL